MDQKDFLNQIKNVVLSYDDKLARRGVIHKNKASNLKSKLTRRVNAIA